MTPPECAHCHQPAAAQRYMGSRIRAGERERVYAWLCVECIGADVREGRIELELKRRG